jgi:D-glucosaminate-6-phosphate ammonia-lyase
MPTRPTAQDNSDWTWHDDNGLTRVINVNGTMTSLGASRAHPDVARATAEAMGHFLRIHEMQAKASATIAALTGAEAGCLTASASAGITLAVAGCITGLDPARAEALPRNPGARCEVAVQAGHLCAYGAPVSTAVELAGGTVRSVGQSTLAMDHQLRAALGPQTAAGLYVVSHHVVHYGQVPFGRFTEICHAAARSGHRRRGIGIRPGGLHRRRRRPCHLFRAQVHGRPTAGIIAGRRDLVRAAYLQNIGIGRGMKIARKAWPGRSARWSCG